ncbi:hypothetical protein KI387_007995, partial [Taxus chinensis]
MEERIGTPSDCQGSPGEWTIYFGGMFIASWGPDHREETHTGDSWVQSTDCTVGV